MRALMCKELGPADQCVIEELPEPTAAKGQVVVDVKAGGINYPDALLIAGKYQVKLPPPFIPGNEAAGVISEIGEGVNGYNIGDRVIISPEIGAFAEKVVLPVERILPMASNMSFEQAAGFTITYATTYHAYKQSAQLKAEDTVLVLGAAGGVGVTAIELAKAKGCRVIAAASSDEKLAFAKEVGADELINYSEKSLKDEVKALTQGKGVDVVYDPVGGELAIQALKATAWQGRYLVIGFACGDIPKLPANLALLKEASIIGVWWGAWAARNPADAKQNFIELITLVEEGKLVPRVTETHPLNDFAKAFDSVTGRRAKGKVILTMD